MGKPVAKTINGLVVLEIDFKMNACGDGIAEAELNFKFGACGDLTGKNTCNTVNALIRSDTCVELWLGFPYDKYSHGHRNNGKRAPPHRRNHAGTVEGFPQRHV